MSHRHVLASLALAALAALAGCSKTSAAGAAMSRLALTTRISLSTSRIQPYVGSRRLITSAEITAQVSANTPRRSHAVPPGPRMIS